MNSISSETLSEGDVACSGSFSKEQSQVWKAVKQSGTGSDTPALEALDRNSGDICFGRESNLISAE